MDAPLLPAYGAATLADLLPSIASRWGFGDDVVGLPDADRWVVLLVDGLGERLLRARADRAPYLAGLLRDRRLTSGVPSTTATSLTSLGTGLAPGQHGIAGYSFRDPFGGGLLNALTWKDGLSALDVQPRLTVFERLEKAGVATSNVGLKRFAGSGLTTAAFRGARFVGCPEEADVARRIELAVDAALAGPRTLVYLYERQLDHCGHGEGWRSDAWADTLAFVDGLARALRLALPADVRLVITGDHGMVDVPRERQVVVEHEPDLLADLTLVAGEGRLRQLYTDRPDAVARRWSDRLGASAWVRTRDEAVDEGWFGPVSAQLLPRFGDVLAAMASDDAVMTLSQPKELSLVGMHGSLTPDEMRVPLLVD